MTGPPRSFADLVGFTTLAERLNAEDVTERVGALDLKGKRSIVPAWRIMRPRPIPSRESILEGLTAPSVGRERELAMLEAVSQGHRREEQAVAE